MSDKTSIEWTDSTWNPVAGCDKVAPGCANCYAIREAHRMAGNPNPKIRAAYEGLTRVLPNGKLDWTGVMRTLSDRLTQPLRKSAPTKFFVNSLSDLFHEFIPFEYIEACFGVMALGRQHTFQILTKRPERAAEWFRWFDEKAKAWAGPCPHAERAVHRLWKEANNADRWLPGEPITDIAWPLSNVWIGTSVSVQKDADANFPHLLRIPAAVRFLSVEPLLGPIEFSDASRRADAVEQLGKPALSGIGWVIVGGESGHGARPCDVEWIRSIVRQCAAVNVPCFVKQLGAKPCESLDTFTVQPCGDPGHFYKDCRAWKETVQWAEHDGKAWPLLEDRKGGSIEEWPADLDVRQFPEVA